MGLEGLRTVSASSATVSIVATAHLQSCTYMCMPIHVHLQCTCMCLWPARTKSADIKTITLSERTNWTQSSVSPFPMATIIQVQHQGMLVYQSITLGQHLQNKHHCILSLL